MRGKRTRRRHWHDTFALWARGLRAAAAVAIVIFVICYLLGAFAHIGKTGSSYLKAGLVVTVTLGCAILVRSLVRGGRRRLMRALLALPVLFAAGAVAYHIICHRHLYWIILTLLAVAVALNVYEFALNLRAVWRREMVSRESTLVQFVFLYVMTVLSYTLLYTILDPHIPHRLFKMESTIDPLLDFLYLSVVTATTVGYGDIVPLTAGAKVLVMSQTVVCYVFLSILIGLIVSWAGGHGGRSTGGAGRRP
ncbi:MAG: ion channel [bacterium]|jgi:uncharacterized membrane protein|nr:ion channel [candidate division KSB1 bacterium]MDH7560915.1 ion channel [bacterium]